MQQFISNIIFLWYTEGIWFFFIHRHMQDIRVYFVSLLYSLTCMQDIKYVDANVMT